MTCYANELVAWAPCHNEGTKDGYCDKHWSEIFAGMTNKQRQIEKAHLSKIRKQKERDAIQAR